MKLTLCSPKLFDELAGAALREKEVEYNLMLGILRQILTDPARYPGNNLLAVVQEGKRLLLAALRTPPYKLILYSDGIQTEAMELLAHHLRAITPDLPGVLSLNDVSDAWSELWRRLTGARETGHQLMRLHVLRRVEQVPWVSGEARWLTEQDIPALRPWITAFHHEATPGGPTPDPDLLLGRHLAAGTLLVWHDDDRPVSMTALVRPTGGCVCISLVYTPPELRRRGYATALVAEASRIGLARGYECCSLYTDLANPISNSIYRKIGYMPVADWKDIYFETKVGG